jgi:hypothetical protein
MAPVSIIFGPMNLNPTGVSYVDPVPLAEVLRRGRVVDADHDRVPHAAVLREVVHQEPGDLELVQELARLVGRAGPVGVAVEEQPQVHAAAGIRPARR